MIPVLQEFTAWRSFGRVEAGMEDPACAIPEAGERRKSSVGARKGLVFVPEGAKEAMIQKPAVKARGVWGKQKPAEGKAAVIPLRPASAT